MIKCVMVLSSTLCFAGKAMNSNQGIELCREILCQLRQSYASSKIVFASPSSSMEFCKIMKNICHDLSITYIGGNQSIELILLEGNVGCIISEIFSLVAISLLSERPAKIVSIEKTILNDYPSYSQALLSRIKEFRKFAMNCLSLNEILV